ncbi:ribosome maturation factor RimM [Vallitalea sp.]|jgi:16S rRNA processing protein RimM|uniref:ribosome maturation factor RimM n=1 Tax=Vallitalea sp. TaxID=1882829 RepID=UPI0025D2CC35|nr:ribosome maturation factor RimM [Vallitalea sp.]MCT4687398.1 ribosome maturation factor RimM [Vallitalea sp.]
MDYFNIGKIVNTHGIRGEVKIIPLTDEPKRFELLEYVYIDNNRTIEKYTINSIRYFKNMIIIKFDELKDMTSAEKLKQSIIKIPRELALPLEDDEYYVQDLIGIDVSTDAGRDLGTIKDIIFTGSNDVYVIETDDKKEILIPAIKQCIKQVDMKNKTMIVLLLEGLIDE